MRPMWGGVKFNPNEIVPKKGVENFFIDHVRMRHFGVDGVSLGAAIAADYQRVTARGLIRGLRDVLHAQAKTVSDSLYVAPAKWLDDYQGVGFIAMAPGEAVWSGVISQSAFITGDVMWDVPPRDLGNDPIVLSTVSVRATRARYIGLSSEEQMRAVCRELIEHEIDEHLLVDGVRVFDPHAGEIAL